MSQAVRESCEFCESGKPRLTTGTCCGCSEPLCLMCNTSGDSKARICPECEPERRASNPNRNHKHKSVKRARNEKVEQQRQELKRDLAVEKKQELKHLINKIKDIKFTDEDGSFIVDGIECAIELNEYNRMIQVTTLNVILKSAWQLVQNQREAVKE